MSRFVLLNARTLYPVAEVIGQPVAEPVTICPACHGNRYGLEECATCHGKGFVRSKAISARAETQAGAALEILEAWGFAIEPCCDPREPGDYVCDECRADAEAQTEAGRL